MNQPYEEGPPIYVKGILIPVGWNSRGEITLLAVADFSEKEYRIDDADMIAECESLLQKLVELYGVPYFRGNEQWLRVISYRLLPKAGNTNSGNNPATSQQSTC